MRNLPRFGNRLGCMPSLLSPHPTPTLLPLCIHKHTLTITFKVTKKERSWLNSHQQASWHGCSPLNMSLLPPVWTGSFSFLLSLHFRAGPCSEFPMNTLSPHSTWDVGSSIFPLNEECLHATSEEMEKAGTEDLNDSPRSHHRSGWANIPLIL